MAFVVFIYSDGLKRKFRFVQDDVKGKEDEPGA
jgi:hypothetical protein